MELKQADKEEQVIIDEIIKNAAKEADITIEQSRVNLITALKQIQKYTLQTGGMDLSSIGTEVHTRSWNQRRNRTKIFKVDVPNI